MITVNDIKKVMALFDEEDKPYILMDRLFEIMIPKENYTSEKVEECNKVKTKVRGNKNGKK